MNRLAWLIVLWAVGLPTFSDSPDHSTSVSSELEALQHRAVQGDPKAQLDLGLRYLIGNGVAENNTEALRWMTQAASQGYAVAQYNLGVYYSDADTQGHNDKEAVKWLRRSAEQGYPPAQFSLGMMYADGRGVPQDNIEAFVWVSLAQAAGDDNSEALERLRDNLSDSELATAEQRRSAYQGK